jgi:hypothetical protein
MPVTVVNVVMAADQRKVLISTVLVDICIPIAYYVLPSSRQARSSAGVSALPINPSRGMHAVF